MKIREISPERITRAVEALCIQANRELPPSLEGLIRGSTEQETSPVAQTILGDLHENLEAAREMQLPICQDTGMAVVFAEIGQ